MRLDGSSRPPSTHVEWSCIWKVCRLPKSKKKGRGDVFFSSTLGGKGGLPGDSELASTWLISVFDMLRCPCCYVAKPQTVLVGGSQGVLSGLMEKGRGVMMFGRAELVGRLPPCQKYFPSGPCRACLWVDAGLSRRYLGNKGTGRMEGEKKKKWKRALKRKTQASKMRSPLKP